MLTLEDAAETVRDFQHLMDDIRRMSQAPTEVPHGAKKDIADADAAQPDSTPRASAINGAFTARETKELYKPVRLPWRAVSCLTRTIQVIWLGVGVTAAMRESRVLLVDHQVSHIVEERRLHGPDHLMVPQKEHMNTTWPYGTFIRIEAVQCIPCEYAWAWSESPVVVRTPFARYALRDSAAHETSTEELFCGFGLGCIAFRRLPDSLLLGDRLVRLQLPHRAGRLSGALSGCEGLLSEHGAVCLVLAVEVPSPTPRSPSCSLSSLSWERKEPHGQQQQGQKHLQVLHVSLEGISSEGQGHVSVPSSLAANSAWACDVPVKAQAFHLQGGLLWILSSGLLEAWSVQANPHLLRQWTTDLPRGFQPTALCRLFDCGEQGEPKLLVAGHSSLGPGLLQLAPPAHANAANGRV